MYGKKYAPDKSTVENIFLMIGGKIVVNVRIKENYSGKHVVKRECFW
jgi:hypothetical protein